MQKPYPDGMPWMETSDPPEFRRFFDLRARFSASRMMQMLFYVPPSLRTPSIGRDLPGLGSRIQMASAFSTKDPDRKA